MQVINIISAYLFFGLVFSAAFEYLMYKTKYERKATKNWERVFWITCWPYCVLRFFKGMFK